jgi:5-oxoprolinase (ATP-hydrolysing) subunit A
MPVYRNHQDDAYIVDQVTSGSAVLDLNSDLGEGLGIWTLGDDEAILGIVTSANIACGFHAGDPTIMRRVCAESVRRGVAIGAQVGYRDLVGFGRRRIDVDPAELANDVIYQIGALDGFARVAGDRVRYVKPHGALYNTIVTDAEQAAAVVEAVSRYDASLPVLGLPRSQWLRQAAAAGLTVVAEAFADRAYTPEGHLVSRRLPGAVLHDPDVIAARCVELARTGTVQAVDGSVVEVPARSLCIHGDTPGAVEIARRVRAALLDAGVVLRPFAGDR